MKPPNQQRCVDLAELKNEMVKKLGLERSKQYFYYLNRFFNLKLCKIEFNRLCFRIIGRENLPLHNQLVHSVLNNACNAKVRPPKEVVKSVDKKSEPNQLFLSNGDINGDHKHLINSNSDIKLENRDLSRKSVQHHQVLTKDSQNEGDVSNYRHNANISKILPEEAICSEDRKINSNRSLVQAHKTFPASSTDFCGASSFSIGSLLDSSALRERMEKIAVLQGLKGVTMDCASLLNKGLDSYLKGLISSGVSLVGARLDGSTEKQESNLKSVNGVTPGHHHKHMLGNIREMKPYCPVSSLDFKVAIELNPQQLGEDWPLHMEKISTLVFSEE